MRAVVRVASTMLFSFSIFMPLKIANYAVSYSFYSTYFMMYMHTLLWYLVLGKLCSFLAPISSFFVAILSESPTCNFLFLTEANIQNMFSAFRPREVRTSIHRTPPAACTLFCCTVYLAT